MTRIGYSCAFIIPSAVVLTRPTDVYNIFGKYDLLAYLLWIALITCIEPFLARYHIEEVREEKKTEG